MSVDAGTTTDQAMRRAAVLGSPITHSLSPVLHEAGYQALDLRGWRYDKIECDEARLPGLVDAMGCEWAGLSLTMPLKRVAMVVADEVSPLASAVGGRPPPGGRGRAGRGRGRGGGGGGGPRRGGPPPPRAGRSSDQAGGQHRCGRHGLGPAGGRAGPS